jgi:nicotinamidase-related amidase
MKYPIVPSRMALLTVDLQNCFVERTSHAPVDGLAVLERINRLAGVCRDAGIVVIHSRHVLEPDGSNIGLLREIAFPARFGMLNPGAPSSKLHPRLAVDPRDLLLDKPRFGCFYGTDLESMLRTRGVDTLIISGIATNICCDTTAREAVMRDFRVFFLSDGTATTSMGTASAEELQQITLATMACLFAEVLTVDELIVRIQAQGGLCPPSM